MSSTRKGPARPKASTASVEAGSRNGADQPGVNLMAPEWGQVMGDVMQMWMEQLAQGQRTSLALVDSQMRLWQDMQANATRLWAGAAPEDLHVMPDSAGPALCPPLDFTPAGLTRSTLGTLQAISAAWSTAVQHELQDMAETSRPRH